MWSHHMQTYRSTSSDDGSLDVAASPGRLQDIRLIEHGEVRVGTAARNEQSEDVDDDADPAGDHLHPDRRPVLSEGFQLRVVGAGTNTTYS